ncbi:hypothetical protein GCM10023238_27900 [Streptomyces heliomycini]
MVTLLDGRRPLGGLLPDAAFQTAGARPAGGGVDARIHLLEPVAEVSVLVGDTTTSARDERPVRPARPGARHEQSPGDAPSSQAEVPEIEIDRYAVDLRSLAHGTAVPAVVRARARPCRRTWRSGSGKRRVPPRSGLRAPR